MPAFMIADLYGGIDEMIVIHLSLTKEDPYGTRSGLNYAEVKTIVDFLELYLDDPDANFHHHSIAEALAVFWRPLLKQRKKDADKKVDVANPEKPGG